MAVINHLKYHRLLNFLERIGNVYMHTNILFLLLFGSMANEY